MVRFPPKSKRVPILFSSRYLVRSLLSIGLSSRIVITKPNQLGSLRGVASGKIKVDKAYNQVKRFQRIKEAEAHVKNDLKGLDPSELFDLQFGNMETLGENIPDNSVDLIFTDPPYNEASLSLYADLARLADRVLRPGGSLVTYVGHYAIFKINDLIQAN